MYTTNLNAAIEFITDSIELNTPLLLWGSPGLGKSAGVAQATDQVGGVLVDVRLSLYESVDLRGLMDFSSQGQTVWMPPATLPFEGNTSFPTDKPVVLFLDEMLHASPSVLAVAFQLVLDRRIGEHRLMPNVRIVAASNRAGDKSGVGRLPAALSNRFDHIEVTPDLTAWKQWAVENEIVEPVIAYLSAKPEMLDCFDQALKSGDKAFPTPRAWATVSRKISVLGADSPRLSGHLTATLGEGCASELMAFIQNRERMIPLSEVLKAPKTARLPEEGDVDVLYSMASMLALRADPKNIEKVMTYTQRLPLEYQVLVLRDINELKPMVALASPTAKKMRRLLDSTVYGD